MSESVMIRNATEVQPAKTIDNFGPTIDVSGVKACTDENFDDFDLDDHSLGNGEVLPFSRQVQDGQDVKEHEDKVLELFELQTLDNQPQQDRNNVQASPLLEPKPEYNEEHENNHGTSETSTENGCVLPEIDSERENNQDASKLPQENNCLLVENNDKLKNNEQRQKLCNCSLKKFLILLGIITASSVFGICGIVCAFFCGHQSATDKNMPAVVVLSNGSDRTIICEKNGSEYFLSVLATGFESVDLQLEFEFNTSTCDAFNDAAAICDYYNASYLNMFPSRQKSSVMCISLDDNSLVRALNFDSDEPERLELTCDFLFYRSYDGINCSRQQRTLIRDGSLETDVIAPLGKTKWLIDVSILCPGKYDVRYKTYLSCFGKLSNGTLRPYKLC